MNQTTMMQDIVSLIVDFQKKSCDVETRAHPFASDGNRRHTKYISRLGLREPSGLCHADLRSRRYRHTGTEKNASVLMFLSNCFRVDSSALTFVYRQECRGLACSKNDWNSK